MTAALDSAAGGLSARLVHGGRVPRFARCRGRKGGMRKGPNWTVRRVERAFAEQSIQMSLAEFIAPLLEEGEPVLETAMGVKIGYKDGHTCTVSITAQVVKYGIPA